MKKILIVNSFYYPHVISGAEIFTQMLAESLQNQLEVVILTTGTSKSKLLQEEIGAIQIYRLPCLNIYPTAAKNKSVVKKLIWHLINLYHPWQKRLIKKLLEEIQPDLIHTQNLSGIGTYLWNVGNQLQIPIIHTLHDNTLFQPTKNQFVNKLAFWVNKKRSKNVTAIVGVSQFILNKHLNKKMFAGAVTEVIYNAIHSKSYASRIRKDQEPLSIGFFGQLEENKGILTLLKALELIDSEMIASLVICGAGNLESKIKEAAKKDQRIVFKGKMSLEEVYQSMAQIDLTVVPSEVEESFGRIVIESYAQGTPVIATNIGALPEIIPQHQFLFESNNPQSLKSAIEHFYHIPTEEVFELKQSSMRYARKFQENNPQFLKLYSRLTKLTINE